MGKRGPTCSVCKRKEVAEIDGLIAGGKLALENICVRYGVSKSVLYAHKKNHVGVMRRQGVPKLDDGGPAPPQLPPSASALERVEADIRFLEERRAFISASQSPTRDRDVSSLQAQINSSRRLHSKLMGGEITAGQYSKSPHFQRIWKGIFDVLKKYPKCFEEVRVKIHETTGLHPEEI